MTDQKNNHKINSNYRNKLTFNDHVSSLPLLKTFDSSQKMLITFTPTWIKWASNNLANHTHCKLSHFQNNTLSINCANASIASQIKHKQVTLLEFFNLNGHNNIKTIKYRIDNSIVNANHNKITDSTLTNNSKPLSESTIKTLQHCQKITVSDKLSNSLKKLEETLKDN